MLFLALLASLIDQPQVALRDDHIRLGDIVRLDPRASAIGVLVVAKLPPGSAGMTISRDQLRALAHRAVPGLQLGGGAGGAIHFVRPAKPKPVREARCYESVGALLAGEALTRQNVSLTTCDPQRREARIHLSEGEIVASSTVAPGTYFGRLAFGDPRAVRRGDRLTLRATAGPVTIEREVAAMQTGTSRDRRIFVRTDDGQVVSVDVQLGQQP